MHAIAQLNSAIQSWSHGFKGLVRVYGMIAVFSLIGLVRGKASVRAYVFWQTIKALW